MTIPGIVPGPNKRDLDKRLLTRLLGVVFVVLAAGCAGDDQIGSEAAAIADEATNGEAAIGDERSSTTRQPTTRARSGSPSDRDRTAEDLPPTCLQHDGVERCYEVLVPDSVSGGASVPVVIDLHGLNWTTTKHRAASRFDELAEEQGFVAVWPIGLDTSWNAGPGCCFPSENNEVDDVGFLAAVVDDVLATQPVDPDRVYVTGLSNGCGLAQSFTAMASELVAAMACVSMYLIIDPPTDYTPTPILEIHATADDFIPYDDRLQSRHRYEFGTALENLDEWAAHNGCSGSPVESAGPSDESFYTSYEQCENGVTTKLLTLPDDGHIAYQDRGTEVDTTWEAWVFMSAFSR